MYKRLIRLIASYDMVHRYVLYNGHRLIIHISFMVNVCVCEGFGSNGFVIKMQPFPIDGHYRTDVISGVGHPKSDSIVSLVLRTVCCAMVRALALYYRSVGIASTLLRNGNISGRLYC
jgi:hypothetical protein